MFMIFFKGLALGASLIVAIGLQNAFVLRQGIKNRHIFASALTASLVDVALIGAGVLGFGYLIEQHPDLIQWITWGGAAFLFFYGLKSFLSAMKPENLDDDSAKGMMKQGSVKETVLILLGISFLNPHVYLDTVVLIGGLSASYGNIGKYWFGGGAMVASFIWFFTLGYGARLLSPLFAKPKAWQILDILIGITMWGIALSLIL
ncbi:MAG TPA: LysE/ArgO family amino acid transporter [Alphaproteobacteria bacterium]|nr:LysE/ArgO family amino acid transporter [Alphaproteobacteria bacterium]